MSYKSQSIAKTLTLLSLATFLTSSHFGIEWYQKSKLLAATNAKTSKEVAEYQNTIKRLSGVLKKDGAPVALDKSLSQLMLDIYNNRAMHGITLTSVAPAKIGATSNGMASTSTLADELPGVPAMKSVKVVIAGSYKTYPDLMEYLEGLKSLPVSLVSLKLQERNFEAGVRLYGVGE